MNAKNILLTPVLCLLLSGCSDRTVPETFLPEEVRTGGELAERLDRNLDRLESDIYRPDVVFKADDRKPGLDAWFGNEFNRNNAWFDGLDLFVQYLKRCNLMLQQGRYVADAAYFIGEDAPKMTGVCNPPLPQGYSFDYINAEVLLKHSRVADGRLVLDSGMEYSVLVLPDQVTMRPEVLRRIQQMVWEGLTIIGPAPEKSPSLQDYGKGRVYDKGTPLETVFSDLGVKPDFCTDVPAEGKVSFIHRTLGNEGDIYFVANQKEAKADFKASFRVGDDSLPEEQRKTWTNISPWKAGSELQPSGLLGPVTLKACTIREE